MNNRFASAIEHHLQRKNLTAGAFAQRIGMNPMLITRLKKGEVSDPGKINRVIEGLSDSEKHKAELQSALLEDYINNIGGKSSMLDIRVIDHVPSDREEFWTRLSEENEIQEAVINLGKSALRRKEISNLLEILAKEIT